MEGPYWVPTRILLRIGESGCIAWMKASSQVTLISDSPPPQEKISSPMPKLIPPGGM